jgi:hypothetical protein
MGDGPGYQQVDKGEPQSDVSFEVLDNWERRFLIHFYICRDEASLD